MKRKSTLVYVSICVYVCQNVTGFQLLINLYYTNLFNLKPQLKGKYGIKVKIDVV